MSKTFVIAEAGINHNGNIDIAKAMIDIAVRAGADAVKFQTFWGIHRLEKYELTANNFHFLHRYCQSKNITFLSTPHTFEAIHFLDNLVPMYKIASTYLTNANFLREVADKGKPILLSTGSIVHNDGMATDEEIRNALSFIPDADVTLMHCVSKYPCDNANIGRVNDLTKFGLRVGLSDHTLDETTQYFPFVEKHFMIEGIKCPDESVSLNFSELSQFIKNIRSKLYEKI